MEYGTKIDIMTLPPQMETRLFESRLTFVLADTTAIYNIGKPESHWKIAFTRSGIAINARIFYDSEDGEWDTANYEFHVRTLEESTVLRYGQQARGAIQVVCDDMDDIKRETTVYAGDFQANSASAALGITVKVIENYMPCSPIAESDDGKHSFDLPGPHTDTVLVVGSHKVYVNKFYLAAYCKYFEKLLLGDYYASDKENINSISNNNNNNEIEVEEVDYEAFIEFLRVIHPERKRVTKENVKTLLALAERFECHAARRECAEFLSNCRTFTIFEKLLLADRHGLTAWEDAIIASMSKSVLLAACNFGREKFSDRLKTRLFKVIC